MTSVLTHAEHEYLHIASHGAKLQFSGIEFSQLNEQNLTTLSKVQSGKNIFEGIKKLLESLHHETYDVVQRYYISQDYLL